jgi:hypothetical protein
MMSMSQVGFGGGLHQFCCYVVTDFDSCAFLQPDDLTDG